MYKLTPFNQILRSDGASIPGVPENSEYEKYLAWLSEGNTPEPADPPPAPSLKMIGVEFEGVMCSATKDDQTGLMAVLLATQMQGATFRPTRYDFANGNALVLTKENIAAFTAVWMPFRQGFFTVAA